MGRKLEDITQVILKLVMSANNPSYIPILAQVPPKGLINYNSRFLGLA